MQKENNAPIFPWGSFFGFFYDKKGESTPLYIDTKKGGFYFLYDMQSALLAFSFLENIVTKFVEYFPLGDLKINVIDFGKNKLPHLAMLKEKNILRYATTINKANILFEYLEEQIFLKRHHQYFNHQYPNINEYNLHNEKRLNYQLLLINLADFPNALSSKKRVDSFLESAFDAGIYIIAYANKKLLHNQICWATKSIFNYLPKLEIYENQFFFTNELFEFKEIVQKYHFEYLNDALSTIVKELLLTAQPPKQSLVHQYKKDLLQYNSHHEYKMLMKNEEDKVFWSTLLKQDNLKAYEEYLKRFPDGLYKNEAKEKIKKLELKKEKTFWQRSCEQNTVFSYEEYLKVFPNGLFYEEAKKRIKQIKDMESKLQEIIDWADKNSISKDAIPRDLYSLSQLKELNLQYYHLKELPASLVNLEHLTSLNLHHNDFNIFPPVILQMKNLKKLDLSWNNIFVLPDEIANLQNLEEIKLDLNHIFTPPKTINQLKPRVQKEILEHIKKNKLSDEKAWEEALRNNSKHGFKKYLASFPNGLHTKEAQFFLEEFLLWEKISQSQKDEALQLLQEYIQKYPQGRYLKKAKKLLKKYSKKLPKTLQKYLSFDMFTTLFYRLKNKNKS